MTSDDVIRWVALDERAWRDGDLEAVDRLFADDPHYLTSPDEQPAIGRDATRAFDEGEVFTMTVSPIAVEGRDAVVRVEVHYGDPERQEHRDLRVLRFAEDGRAEFFEEWAYWPGKPSSPGSSTS